MRLLNASLDRLEVVTDLYKEDSNAFCALGDVLTEIARLSYNNDNKNGIIKNISYLKDAIDHGYKEALKIKKNKFPAIVMHHQFIHYFKFN